MNLSSKGSGVDRNGGVKNTLNALVKAVATDLAVEGDVALDGFAAVFFLFFYLDGVGDSGESSFAVSGFLAEEDLIGFGDRQVAIRGELAEDVHLVDVGQLIDRLDLVCVNRWASAEQRQMKERRKK